MRRIASPSAGWSPMSRIGQVGKTSRWAFLVSEENASAIIDALQANYFQAAVSPLHNMDEWDRPGVIRYMKSWDQRRNGVRFLHDDDFDSVGLSFDDCLIPAVTPAYVVWPAGSAKPSDLERYATCDSSRGKLCYAELPSPGSKKKSHHHIQVNLDYAMTRATLLGKLGVPEESLYYWEPVNSWQGLLRYFAHMDNPEKSQYSPSDIRSIFGFDLSPVYHKTEALKDSEMEYLFRVVSSLKGCNIYSLSAKLIADGRSDLARAVKASSGYWKEVCFQLNKVRSASYVTGEPQADYRRTDLEYVPDDSTRSGSVDAEAIFKRLSSLPNSGS